MGLLKKVERERERRERERERELEREREREKEDRKIEPHSFYTDNEQERRPSSHHLFSHIGCRGELHVGYQ